jgi:hypothetical protein
VRDAGGAGARPLDLAGAADVDPAEEDLLAAGFEAGARQLRGAGAAVEADAGGGRRRRHGRHGRERDRADQGELEEAIVGEAHGLSPCWGG